VTWERIAGNWPQFKGSARQEWNALSEAQLDAIAGKRYELIGGIQEAYGMGRAETERQIANWQARLPETQP
jgi:uncharacterized protein YjbJ (UPF0337 family)